MLCEFYTTLRPEDSEKLLAKPTFPARIARLANGLTVIHQSLPATPVVTVDVWVQAGAIVEPEDWAGTAHFLEHLIFKGTDRIPPGVFDAVIENRGGVTNAATSHDYAHYFICTSATDLPDTLPYLADLLLNATIPDDEFDRERLVVLEELRQAGDDPDWIGFQTLMGDVYRYHPYGRSVLGDADRLWARSPQDLRNFHRSHYQPDNMTVVIVGDVDWQMAIAEVQRAFQSSSSNITDPLAPALICAEPPLTEIRRQVLELPRIEQARLMMAWLGPGVDQLHTAYGLDLLSVVVAGSQSSRLVRELREERQLVQDIQTNFSLQRDSSLFTLTAWSDPENLERVEALIGDRLSILGSTPISTAELARHQRLLCTDYAFSTETSSQLAGLYGYYSTIADAELSVTYPEQIRSLTREDLQQLASDYLSPYRYAVTILQSGDR